MRFSTKPFVDHDSDKQEIAADLQRQARRLIKSGRLSAADYESCFSLADLRKAVETAKKKKRGKGVA